MTIAEKGIAILKQYAKESGVLLRSTSDLSPLEQWLTLQLINKQISDEEIENQFPVINLRTDERYNDRETNKLRQEGAKWMRDKQKTNQ
ncbi:MAG: hypothetical protein H8E98_03080 [Bacteroidetes bacterium]|nr:hypothetical protein [Bacteroidota bacterium]